MEIHTFSKNLHDELMHLIEMYGIEVENDDDEEIIAITLQMILAMRKKREKIDFSE